MVNNPTVEGQTAANQLAAEVGRQSSSIMQSLSDMTNQVVSLAPKAIGAVLVLVVGYVVARFVSRAAAALAARLGLQRAAESGGLVESMQQVGINRTVPQIVGIIIFWLLMCLFLVASCDILDLPAVTAAIEKIIAYIPKLLVATVLVVVGMLLAAFVRGIVATSADRVGITYADQLATGCYYVLAMMTFIAAFEQLEIKIELLNYAILIAFGAVAVAVGLSIGLGGREVMAGILSGYYVRQRLRTGDRVTVAGLQGTIREVGPVATIIETEEGGVMYRHSIPNTRMLNEAVR